MTTPITHPYPYGSLLSDLAVSRRMRARVRRHLDALEVRRRSLDAAGELYEARQLEDKIATGLDLLERLSVAVADLEQRLGGPLDLN